MLNEANNLTVNANIFDFKLKTSPAIASEQQLKPSACIIINNKQIPQQRQKKPIQLQLSQSDLSNVAGNLNWKFLEEIKCLDNQLRNVECNYINTNECHSAYDASAKANSVNESPMHDVNVAVKVNGVRHETITCKSNGYANNEHLNDDILSQQSSPDINLLEEQVQYPNFQFTTPKSTFKRKKERLLQQQQQQQQELLKAQQATAAVQSPITYETYQQYTSLSLPRQKPSIAITATAVANEKEQQNYDPTAMISSGTIAPNNNCDNRSYNDYISDISGGTPATRSIKTRTLPAISRTSKTTPTHPNSYAATAGVDLVVGSIDADNTASTSHTTTTTNKLSRRHITEATMDAATHHGGGGGGGCGSGSGSSGDNDKQNLKHSFVHGIGSALPLFGWRKNCLYLLLVLLMLLITTNMVLTLWIMKVMEFSKEGMGQLKILPGGVQLTGQAIIMDTLRASTIRSRHGQPIAIESSRNFSINTRDTNGMLENHLFLGHDKLECLATEFRINDTTGRNLFSVNRNEVTIGAHALKIDGEGGAIFRESIQTPHVRAEPGRELRLESLTRQLEMTAARDINLQSRAGGIELSALEDVKLSALDGSLRLESSKILMPNLRTAQPPLPGTAQSRDHMHRVFQLCACSNGKLFLASPHSICAGDDSTVCR